MAENTAWQQYCANVIDQRDKAWRLIETQDYELMELRKENAKLKQENKGLHALIDRHAPDLFWHHDNS